LQHDLGSGGQQQGFVADFFVETESGFSYLGADKHPLYFHFSDIHKI
jgi:hypothetical protein